jgi:hypothetical protein
MTKSRWLRWLCGADYPASDNAWHKAEIAADIAANMLRRAIFRMAA